jgi:hypothetical protein
MGWPNDLAAARSARGGGGMGRRWRVVVPGFLVGAGLSALLGLATIEKAGLEPSAQGLLLGILVCGGPLAGPLAEPLAYVDFDPVRMVAAAAVLLALIALHPLRPAILTALVSGTALAVWFVWGLAMTYYGV